MIFLNADHLILAFVVASRMSLSPASAAGFSWYSDLLLIAEGCSQNLNWDTIFLIVGSQRCQRRTGLSLIHI